MSANQLLSETTSYSGLAGSRIVGYAYDMDGRRSQLAYPNGTVVDYAHTPRGQLAAITADGPPPLAAFTYDPSGLPVSRTLENNTTIAYAYDGAGRLLSVAHSGNGTALRTIAYTLDPNGRRTSREDNGALEIYGYDPTGQLTSVANSTNATYAYDPVGNRQSVTGAVPGAGTYLADALNRYTAAPGGGAAYDPRGNLVAHAGHTLSYDSRNRLVSATVGGHTVTTTYDHRNRAVKRTVDGTATYFVWDDWSLIAELDASGGVLQRYIQGPGIDNLIAKTNAAGTVYYHQDGLGSTVALTDAAGTVVETYTYDAFGKVKILDPSTLATRPSSLFGNRFLFTGREYLAEVGLYDYRNRAYDPELGRFLQTDPIRFEAGDVNLYRYVGNRPVNWVDPLGESPLSIGGAFAIWTGACGLYAMNTAEATFSDDKKQHCMAGCLFTKCMAWLPGFVLTPIAGFGWEIVGGWQGRESERDLIATAKGVVASFTGDCKNECDKCKVAP